MQEPNAIDLVSGLANARVLCLGDVMLDRFIYGSVARISPEAPIPVMSVQREAAMLGGAGNVARNVVALGGRASLVAVVGDDDAGREITRLMAQTPNLGVGLVTVPGRSTTVKTRFVAGTYQLLRADQETIAPVDRSVGAKIFDAFRAELEDCDVVVLSNYAKGVLTDQLLFGAIEAARRMNKRVLVDPKSTNFARYRGADLLKPNSRELAAATGEAVDTDAAVEVAARKVLAETGVGALLVTRSEFGMTLVTDTQCLHLPASAREVYDVSGAGDTVIATLAAALSAKLDLSTAAQLANAAAGVVVGKVGTSVVHPEELHAALRAGTIDSAEAKVMGLARAMDEVARWRTQGKRVAFTNGCFDLLHPGHVSLLKQARAAADRLIVGLNSDASVARLKGPTRPVQSEAARGLVLASLEAVDMVVPFGEDTPLALIEALRPDVLVKGADYQLEEVVGRDLVESYGGKVLLARLEQGHSTTRMVQKIASGG